MVNRYRQGVEVIYPHSWVHRSEHDFRLLRRRWRMPAGCIRREIDGANRPLSGSTPLPAPTRPTTTAARRPVRRKRTASLRCANHQHRQSGTAPAIVTQVIRPSTANAGGSWTSSPRAFLTKGPPEGFSAVG
jgi:hypothetical protein